MILFLLAALLLTLVALAPLALSLRARGVARSRRQSAIALHRAQLDELDRDLALGLVLPVDHATARLEIERRLLAADRLDERRSTRGAPLVVVALAAIPVAAVLLYLVGGHPRVGAEPLASRLRAAAVADRGTEALIAQLREAIATVEPGSDSARQGDVMLGQMEARLARWDEAAAAWRAALAIRFDPTLAYEAAEAATRGRGTVGPDEAALFRRAVDAAPPDAPWRLDAEARIAQSEHH